MARERSSSLPPPGNPFWSDRATSEWLLSWARPAYMPVPEWEEPENRVERTMNGGPEVPSLGDTFRTPASWTSEGQQGAGALHRAPQRGMQTEGPLPKKVLEEGGSEQLRKALEETMMEQVLEENRQLQEELQRLRREQGDTGGGHRRQEPMTREDRERTPPPRPPTWPPPSSPQSRRQKKVVYTPQGTEVPSPPRGGFPVEDGSLPFPMPWQGGGEYATEVRQLFPEPASGFMNGGEWEGCIGWRERWRP